MSQEKWRPRSPIKREGSLFPNKVPHLTWNNYILCSKIGEATCWEHAGPKYDSLEANEWLTDGLGCSSIRSLFSGCLIYWRPTLLQCSKWYLWNWEPNLDRIEIKVRTIDGTMKQIGFLFILNSISWNYLVSGNFYCNVIKENSQNARLQWSLQWSQLYWTGSYQWFSHNAVDLINKNEWNVYNVFEWNIRVLEA